MARRETLRTIAREYYDMNGSFIDTLDVPPTALEFSQLAHISRPVIIKGLKLDAFDLWSDDYLIKRMGSHLFSVAVTPNGRADAITSGPDGRSYFVEPFVEKQTMEDLLRQLRNRSEDRDVYYLQSQNGNLFSSTASQVSEFKPLTADVPEEISWASEGLGRLPDAVNLWIGDGRSVTSIHSDPYENIYTVIRGAKYFTLLPPTEGWCLDEHSHPHATYTRPTPSSPLVLTPSDPSISPPIRWSSISNPHLSGTIPEEVNPIHIELLAGDTLYLPVGWWHYVRQSEGTTIALNWWYDCEMRGMSWSWINFLRGYGENAELEEDS